MSGPEWTNDEPEHRDDARSLSPDHDHDQESTPETEPVPNFAQAPEPAMAHADASSDQNDAETDETSSKARPRFSLPSLGFLRLSSLLGSERHEILPDATHHPAEPHAASHSATHKPKRAAASRFPFLGLKAETRVGLVIVISFVILVAAFIVNKRNGTAKDKVDVAKNEGTGKKSLELALNSPADGEPKAGADKDKTPKDEGKKTDPDKGPKSSPPEAPDHPPESIKSATPDPSSTEVEPKATKDLKLVGMAPSAAATELPPSPDLPPMKSPAGEAKPPEAALLADVPALPAVAAAPSTTEPKPPEIPAVPAPDKPAASLLASDPLATPAPPSTEPPVVANAPPTPPVEPPAVVANAPNPTPMPTAPAPAEKIPPLEPSPAPAMAPVAVVPEATGAAAATAALGAGWVVIESGGRRIVGADSTAAPAESPSSSSRMVADGPRPSDELGADQIEPAVHTVRPGENFWTISKLCYGSGRYYKALHAANERQVPNIKALYVGTVLRIPPPEALDRTLIDPVGRAKTDDPATSPVSRTSKNTEVAEDLELAPRPRARMTARVDPEAEKEPRRPTYKVKAYETLRSIARDTLNDPKRDREIYNLNRDVLDEPTGTLPAGTTLTLPEDAIVSGRKR